MSSLVDELIQAPSGEVLEKSTKDQLLKIAEHFRIEVPDKRAKARIKIFLLDKVVEQ